ncbi:C6 finger domain-containing protein [Colletotrichum truncatum]|uniref:C6 finger domain-containing protein n=1 Tax=Colletotrichum truncatum TaxID=5467 RepID=A0ACC3YRP6_COLTU|nr:C6 finger domain-containing protein [Colletotrichum truncatum]KAF6799305.1 C6 finger domain-containing protein [Colletotrichum truncatum]
MTTNKKGQVTKRRPHRKSRGGCLQCKQRHAKCDEHRPICIKCTTTSRRCSYLDTLPTTSPATTTNPVNTNTTAEKPAPITPAPSEATAIALSPKSVIQNTASATSTPDAATLRHSSTDKILEPPPTGIAASPSSPLFEVRDLVLLHHFDTVLMKDPFINAVSDEHGSNPITEIVFQSAMEAPYLLIEILALSAAHISTTQIDPVERTKNLQTAQELQTRALSLFNQAQVHVTDDNCLPMFFFPSILGIHTFFNTVTTAVGLSDFLTKFVQYLHIHRGVRAVTGQSWHIIRNSGMGDIINATETVSLEQAISSSSTDASDSLMELLLGVRPTLSDDLFATYVQAVQQLQLVFKQHHAAPQHLQPHMTISWPIRISSDYISLLQQRQPVALLILTYWAILLHQDHNFWVFGAVGKSLVESVADYLGAYWENC